jgi:hypothetical protein
MTRFGKKTDAFYYGKITNKVSKDDLSKFLINGLLKYEHYHSVSLDKETVGDVLDRWFEHDADSNDFFDNLVDADDFDDFSDRIYNDLQNIKKNIN